LRLNFGLVYLLLKLYLIGIKHCCYFLCLTNWVTPYSNCSLCSTFSCYIFLSLHTFKSFRSRQIYKVFHLFFLQFLCTLSNFILSRALTLYHLSLTSLYNNISLTLVTLRLLVIIQKTNISDLWWILLSDNLAILQVYFLLELLMLLWKSSVDSCPTVLDRVKNLICIIGKRCLVIHWHLLLQELLHGLLVSLICLLHNVGWKISLMGCCISIALNSVYRNNTITHWHSWFFWVWFYFMYFFFIIPWVWTRLKFLLLLV